MERKILDDCKSMKLKLLFFFNVFLMTESALVCCCLFCFFGLFSECITVQRLVQFTTGYAQIKYFYYHKIVSSLAGTDSTILSCLSQTFFFCFFFRRRNVFTVVVMNGDVLVHNK